MSINNGHNLEYKIKQLMDAINDRNPVMAKHILSANFEITTASGEEQKMEEFLSELTKPPEPTMKFRLIPKFDSIFTSEDLAVVRSIHISRDSESKKSKLYRNIHVFIYKDGIWQCVSWQITELKSTEHKLL